MKTLILFCLAGAAIAIVGCSNIDTTGNSNPNAIPSQAGVAGGSGGGSGGGGAAMQKHIP